MDRGLACQSPDGCAPFVVALGEPIVPVPSPAHAQVVRESRHRAAYLLERPHALPALEIPHVRYYVQLVTLRLAEAARNGQKAAVSRQSQRRPREVGAVGMRGWE